MQNDLLELEYSDRYTPAKTPTGAPIKEASPTAIKVPWMAGPIPPSPEPNAPGGLNRNSKLRAPTPFLNTSNKMEAKGMIAIITKTNNKTVIKLLKTFLF